jgi:hypothetical protein
MLVDARYACCGPIAASVRSTIMSSVPCSSCIPSAPAFTAFSLDSQVRVPINRRTPARLSQFYQVKIMGLNAREAPERTASLFELLYPSKGANGISTDKSASVYKSYSLENQ